MNDFVLSCCSTCDISPEHLKNRNIEYIPFHFFMDNQECLDDLGQTISFEDFYRKMEEGVNTRTSQINVSEYVEYFSKFIDQGKDVLHISLSSGLSGTSNSAMNAAKILKERNPERKIIVIDSLAAASGYGLMMDKAADLRDEGKTMEEIQAWIEKNKKKLHHWFFSTDLKYYVKGGRISKTSGFVGSILGICPLLNMNYEGRLTPREKIRTKKKVIRQIVKMMEEHVQDGYDYADKCYICHSACMEDAKEIAAMVEEKFPKMKEKVLINYIGTTIGSHTGPGTCALFFWGDERNN